MGTRNPSSTTQEFVVKGAVNRNARRINGGPGIFAQRRTFAPNVRKTFFECGRRTMAYHDIVEGIFITVRKSDPSTRIALLCKAKYRPAYILRIRECEQETI